MSWASKRRTMYAGGVLLILIGVAAVPVINFLSRPATCFDGIRNQGETAPDKGGPCLVLDESRLSPYSVLWSRAFKVRDGVYSAAAYIENPNPSAGNYSAKYYFSLYDSRNVLVAEREGETVIMPGTITPLFESGFQTGERDVARTYLEIAPQRNWERADNPASALRISNIKVEEGREPRVEAVVENRSTKPLVDISFIAVVFSPAGNARNASKTRIDRIEPDEVQTLYFTWTGPFDTEVGRVDVLPVIKPIPQKK